MIGLLLACSPPPGVDVALEGRGVHLRSESSIRAAQVWQGDRLLVDERLPEPVGALSLTAPWASGPPLRVEVNTPRGAAVDEVETAGRPCSWRLGSSIADAADPGASTPAPLSGPLWVEVVAHADGPVDLGSLGRRVMAVGEIWASTIDVSLGETLSLSCGGVSRTTQIAAPLRGLAEVREGLALRGVEWPADRAGRRDSSRPADALPLPSAAWEGATRRLGLGWRARDPHAPWAWSGVSLVWTHESPVDVVVRQRMLDPEGRPVDATRPRLRGADDGTGVVSALVRLQQGEQRVVLPVFVDEGALAETGVSEVRRVVEVLLPGVAEPVARHEASLPVWRSGSATTVGAAVGLLLSLGGAALLGWGTLRWLPRQPVELLALAALYAALLFVVGTVAQVVGIGVATLLGPYGVLVSALLDDLLQVGVLSTLLLTRPKPGVASLVTAVAWTLRAVALGTIGPFELLILTMRVALLEAWLWLGGVSRGGTELWRHALSLSGVQVVATAIGLCWSSLLYRLTWSTDYVVVMLLGPGLLYTLAAVLLTRRIATSLRQVAP